MRKRIRIRIYLGKKKEIFHLDNQVGAITFIPVLNVIYYLLTLVTARQRRFALFLETVLLLAIGSLLIRLSTGWLLSTVFAHVLTCIGIGIQQQLLDTSPDSRKKLGYVILFSAVFVLAMLAIAFAGRNAQNKMQPVCQEALEALTRRDEKRWQSCLHPTKAADELWDMDAFLSELGIPLRGGWQLERMTDHETEISDKDHYTTAEFRASADGRTYRITITYLRSYEGSGIVDFSIRPD